MVFNFFRKASVVKAAEGPVSQSQPAVRVSTDFLSRLIPVGSLPTTELQQLASSIVDFKAGEVIFDRDTPTVALVYLYQGEVFMETGNGAGYVVDSATFRACYPLSTDPNYRFKAIAKTPCRIVRLPLDALRLGNRAQSARYPLLDGDHLSPALARSAFFRRFRDAFLGGQLKIPSLPDVAFRLRSAVQKDIGISDAVSIINFDPAVASKLIQVVNSPLYCSITPISSCHDAVNRLGLKTTQNLVTGFCLQNLFKSQNKTLNAMIQSIWKQSIQISSLSQVLAALSKKVNPDEALLAGLVHNIGALPLITFADQHPADSYTVEALQQTINAVQDELGGHILKKWDFPAHLVEIPKRTRNWFDDRAEELQLSDIVILAKLHGDLGTPQASKLPPINTLPAFRKLGDNALTPDLSLQCLQDSKQQIAAVINLFRG